MKVTKNQSRNGESGSVIYWIFIAVAMFAALSFTVSKINRGGNTGKLDELFGLYATDILQYATAVQRGVRSMRIEGVDESEICFHTSQWGHTDYEYNPECASMNNRVFNSQGGGVGFQEGVPDWYDQSTTTANDSQSWVFSGRYEVTDVGTDGGTSNTVAANADLVMATAPVRAEVCSAINSQLDYSDPTPPTVSPNIYDGLAVNAYQGSYSNGGDKIPAYGRERCMEDGAGYYVYYKVILAR